MNVLTKLGVSRLWQKVKAYVDNQISSLRNTVYARDQSLAQSIEDISPKEYTFEDNGLGGEISYNLSGELMESFDSVKVGDTVRTTDNSFKGVVIELGAQSGAHYIRAIGSCDGAVSIVTFSHKVINRVAFYTYNVNPLNFRVSKLEERLDALESTVESNHTAAMAETKKYLPLTGGTLTGALTIKMNYPQLTLQQTGGAGVRITTGSKGENFDLKTLAGGYVTTVVGDLNFKTGGWLSYNANTAQFNFNKTVTAPNIPAASAASLDTVAAAAFDTPEADAGVQEGTVE